MQNHRPGQLPIAPCVTWPLLMQLQHSEIAHGTDVAQFSPCQTRNICIVNKASCPQILESILTPMASKQRPEVRRSRGH